MGNIFNDDFRDFIGILIHQQLITPTMYVNDLN
jgi:hypothetical protein